MEHTDKLLSVVIPAYNEEGNIDTVAAAVSAALSEHDIPYEIIFINDGSTDGTWAEICSQASQHTEIWE